MTDVFNRNQISKVDDMLELVAKYGKKFSTHRGSGSAPKDDVILITGSTGAIGSNVLAELAKAKKVTKIYALTRKLAISSLERQKDAMQSRGLKPSLVNDNRITVIDGDITRPGLGLSSEMFDEVCLINLKFSIVFISVSQIRSTVTHIMHIGKLFALESNLALTEPHDRVAC